MKKLSLALAFVTVSLFAIGCDNPTEPDSGSGTTQKTDDGHDHAAPHGGDLIDLGRDHKYHAELVDNHETESLTIYIMDGNLKPLSIDQASVNLTLIAGDKSESFDMPAVAEGNSAEFSSGNEKMMALIDTKGVKGKLRATIEGSPFTGSFTHHPHDHDHDDDHDHDHDHDGDDDDHDEDHDGHDDDDDHK